MTEREPRRRIAWLWLIAGTLIGALVGRGIASIVHDGLWYPWN